MGGKSRGRILAPLALLASVVALVLVIQGSGSSGSGSNTAETTTTATSAKKQAKAKPKTTKPKGPKTYTVQSGDTLGTISTKTGVSVAQIEELNPNLQPNALIVGQKVKLAP